MATSPGEHVTEDARDAGTDAAIGRRKRANLLGAGVTLVLFLLFPVLAGFTHLFDAVVNGIGIGYLVGFGVIVAPVFGAIAYCVSMNRQTNNGRPGGDAR